MRLFDSEIKINDAGLKRDFSVLREESAPKAGDKQLNSAILPHTKTAT
jgi:hypothetical protein